MIYYTVTLPFDTFDLIPLCETENEIVKPELCKNAPLLFSASPRADVLIERCDRAGGERLCPELSSLAIGAFVHGVRGLPTEETEVEIDDKIYKVTFDSKTRSVELKMPKCKVLLSNRSALVENSGVIFSDFLSMGKRIRVVKSKDSDGFSTPALRSLFLREGYPLADAAVAYSDVDEELVIRSLSRDRDDACVKLSLALAALSDSSLVGEGEKKMRFASGESATFFYKGADVWMRLFTGDIPRVVV